MSEQPVDIVAGRSCAGCTMCCKLLSIESLDKPRLQWCTHCDIGVGCKVYNDRPSECRIFNCGYLTQANIGDHWKPANSRMVISLGETDNRLVVYVDPDRSDAWRKEPFYTDIKRWALATAKTQGQVLVAQGRDMIVVTPQGETNLGPVRDDQLIITRRNRGSSGSEFEHIIVDRDDPVLDAMRLLKDANSTKHRSPEDLAEAKRLVDTWLAEQN